MLALRCMQEVMDRAMGTFQVLFDAMHWCRNPRVWVRLAVQSDSRMLCEIVDMYGVPKPMVCQELFLVMVKLYWQLNHRACENMLVCLA